jgi:hypothetical protein
MEKRRDEPSMKTGLNSTSCFMYSMASGTPQTYGLSASPPVQGQGPRKLTWLASIMI